MLLLAFISSSERRCICTQKVHPVMWVQHPTQVQLNHTGDFYQNAWGESGVKYDMGVVEGPPTLANTEGLSPSTMLPCNVLCLGGLCSERGRTKGQPANMQWCHSQFWSRNGWCEQLVSKGSGSDSLSHMCSSLAPETPGEKHKLSE